MRMVQSEASVDSLSKERNGEDDESSSLDVTMEDSSSNAHLEDEDDEAETESENENCGQRGPQHHQHHHHHAAKSKTISMAGIIVDTNNTICGDIPYYADEEIDDALSDESSYQQQQQQSHARDIIEPEAPPPPPPPPHQPPQVEVVLIETDAEIIEADKGLYRYYNKKTAITCILILLVAFVIVDAATSQYIKTAINSFFEWMAANPREGFFAFVLVAFTATMIFIPGILLAIGAGLAFTNALGGLGAGILVGTLAVFIGFAAAAEASFLLGRFLLRDCVNGLTKRFSILEALDNAFEEKGFRIMVLLRLSPLIYAAPALNYGAGGTSISFQDYTLAMWAIIPCTVFFVFLGASAASLASEGGEGGNEKTDKIVMIIGIVVSVIAAAWTSYYAKVELAKVAAASRQQEEGEEAARSEVANDDDDDLDEEAQMTEVMHERTMPLHDTV